MRIFDMCVFFVCPLVKLFFALYSRMPLRRSWTQSTTLTSLLAPPLHSALLQSRTHTHTQSHNPIHLCIYKHTCSLSKLFLFLLFSEVCCNPGVLSGSPYPHPPLL